MPNDNPGATTRSDLRIRPKRIIIVLLACVGVVLVGLLWNWSIQRTGEETQFLRSLAIEVGPPMDADWGLQFQNIDAVQILFVTRDVRRDESMMLRVSRLKNLRIFGLYDGRYLAQEPNDSQLPATMKFGDEQIDDLLALRHLEEVWLDYSRLSDAGLLRLAKHASLKYICVAGTNVTDEGIANFKKRRPECHVIKGLPGYYSRGGEYYCKDCTGKALAKVLELPYVTDITFSCRNLDWNCGGYRTNDDIKILAELPHLEVIDLVVGTFTDEGVEHLMGHPSLKELYIRHHHEVSDEAIARLRESIRQQGRELTVRRR